MKVIDHSVSGETFALEYDDYYKLYRTTPIPENLGSYYQSETYISHTDGSKGLFEKLYQWVKHYTLQRKIRLVEQYVPQGKLLDIGAGTGDFVLTAKQQGWYATGVEPEAKARDDVPRHLWHFSQESIRLLFEEKGFELIGVKPMPFDAFYVSLLSEKYKSGKMNFIKGFYHGLLSNLSALRTGEYSSLIYLLKVKSKR